MTYETINTMPDGDYKIDCTGDVCRGDDILFTEAKFVGSWRNPKFSHTQTIKARVVNDSYGVEKQQHTFTLEVLDCYTDSSHDVHTPGQKIKRKARNVYRNGTYRKEWDDEAMRDCVLNEKHKRGDIARESRDARRELERITKPWKF